MRRGLTLALVLLGAAGLAVPGSALASGAVYTSTNDTAANAVKVFRAGEDGRLHVRQVVGTAGHGTGAGLGSEGAVTLSDDGRWLLVVNAGSNSVSLFHVDHHGRLHLSDVAGSHGTKPISVTESDGLVYTVNSGSASIAGFRFEGWRTAVLARRCVACRRRDRLGAPAGKAHRRRAGRCDRGDERTRAWIAITLPLS
jgi:6-phosphogluconolactonase